MNSLPQVILKSGKERSLLRFHLWVFSGAIKSIKGSPIDGDIVEVFSNQGEYLATGHYQKGSITVRLFSFEQVLPDRDFWMKKIRAAIEARKNLGFLDDPKTNVYRLIHGEGDMLPGLIADFYNGVVVLQAHSAGMYRHMELFSDILVEIFAKNITGIYCKSAGTIHQKDDSVAGDRILWGAVNESSVLEYGNKFLVDHINGQKTGFFIDQRENRQLITRYSANKTVANVFGYTGGFSIYAMQGGASHVDTVDASEKATTQATKNVLLNFPDDTRHESITTDAFEFFKQSVGKYDLIILDPPAFAKHQDARNSAIKAYSRINKMAFLALKPGGILFTFSCSQVVTKDDFRKAVFTGAAQSGKSVRIIHQVTQPSDHPVNIYHPETEYLKGLVLYVE